MSEREYQEVPQCCIAIDEEGAYTYEPCEAHKKKILYLSATSYQKDHACNCPHHDHVELVGIDKITGYLESLERKENLGKLYKITIVEVENLLDDYHTGGKEA